eukprot:4056430-Amphidinium_carterae.1
MKPKVPVPPRPGTKQLLPVPPRSFRASNGEFRQVPAVPLKVCALTVCAPMVIKGDALGRTEVDLPWSGWHLRCATEGDLWLHRTQVWYMDWTCSMRRDLDALVRLECACFLSTVNCSVQVMDRVLRCDSCPFSDFVCFRAWLVCRCDFHVWMCMWRSQKRAAHRPLDGGGGDAQGSKGGTHPRIGRIPSTAEGKGKGQGKGSNGKASVNNAFRVHGPRQREIIVHNSLNMEEQEAMVGAAVTFDDEGAQRPHTKLLDMISVNVDSLK